MRQLRPTKYEWSVFNIDWPLLYVGLVFSVHLDLEEDHRRTGVLILPGARERGRVYSYWLEMAAPSDRTLSSPGQSNSQEANRETNGGESSQARIENRPPRAPIHPVLRSIDDILHDSLNSLLSSGTGPRPENHGSINLAEILQEALEASMEIDISDDGLEDLGNSQEGNIIKKNGVQYQNSSPPPPSSS